MSATGTSISHFLESHRVDFQQYDFPDYSIFRCHLAYGSIRTVIAVDICSPTIGAALRRSGILEAAIEKIRSESGDYPVIITEDRWKHSPKMMADRLLAHLQIFRQLGARNCKIEKIDKPVAEKFLDANHSYGAALCRYKYGMFCKGELVAVAEFSNGRKWIKDGKEIRSYEWIRYASLADTRIAGGMGKMLKHFINEVKPDDIMSYADLEWSDGRVYETLGFCPEGIKSPVMFSVGPVTWRRQAVSRPLSSSADTTSCTASDTVPPESLYFRNFGSLKYRLKLTDYK